MAKRGGLQKRPNLGQTKFWGLSDISILNLFSGLRELLGGKEKSKSLSLTRNFTNLLPIHRNLTTLGALLFPHYPYLSLSMPLAALLNPTNAVFFIPIPCTYTSSPLDGMARNYNFYLHGYAIFHVWIHFFPTFLYPRRRKNI